MSVISKVFKIKGMPCASCAAIIEKELRQAVGVNSVEVNYGTESVKISFDALKTNANNLSKKIEPLGYSLMIATIEETGKSLDQHTMNLGFDQSKKEKMAELADMKIKVFVAIPLAVLVALVMGWEILAQYSLVSEMNYPIKEFFPQLLPLLATYLDI